MAFKVNQNRPGASLGAETISEINVTPMVDVMLVLLIVFMVAAPLMAQGMKVDLPRTQAPALKTPKPAIEVTVDRDGKLFVGKTAVTTDTLVAAIQHEAGNDTERQVNIRGDQHLAYGIAIETMSHISEAGFSHIALESESPSQH
jgi:biopolymer transport protein ExbD